MVNRVSRDNSHADSGRDMGRRTRIACVRFARYPSRMTAYVACAAGFADERADAAVPLVRALSRADGPRYLVYETLAERTLALAQRERLTDPELGYTPRLAAFLRPVLADCIANDIRIVGNFGAANPRGAARRIAELAAALGVAGVRTAVVEGDDLLQVMTAAEIGALPRIEGIPFDGREILAANAYLGADGIVAALAAGANVVVCGRCTDSALALGPLRHAFGWAADDWTRLAAGVLAGHLVECSAQVTGGYFADPGLKDVPNLAEIGYPIAEVDRDGGVVITKPEGTGGLVSTATVKEQLLYEVQDPANYLTPDVVLDLTDVEVAEVGRDRVEVRGAAGRPRPPTLKATVSVDGGWLGEGEISYAGPNALARAEAAADALRRRLEIAGIRAPTRIDVIGAVSVLDGAGAALRSRGGFPADGDYRVRLAGSAPDRGAAEAIAQEVVGLYTCGPAGGGGVRKSLTRRVATASVLVERDRVPVRASFPPAGTA